MSSMSQKLVVIVGATGGQGGSVVKELLARPAEFKLRAITRKPTSPKAQALAAQGVEVVSADLNSYDSLVPAFAGAHAIFAVTDFWELFVSMGPKAAMEIEATQGINMARAAMATPTLQHYVWSTLPDTEKITSGKYMVPHFAGKNRVDAFIKSQPDLLAKTTFLWVSYYASNLNYPLFAPAKVSTAGSDRYILLQPVRPETKVNVISDHTTNVGKFVAAILDQPNLTLPGRFVLADTEVTTQRGLLDAWSRANGGVKTEYVQISLDDYDRLFPAWGGEMGIMLKFWEDFDDQSWTGEEGILSRDDIGVEGLKGLEESMKEIKWQL